MFRVCALAGVLGFALSACDDSSSAGGDGGSDGNRGGIPDTVETFMELSDYDCGKSQKCVATYLTEYHDMAVCDGNNGWVIGTLIEKMDCDFSSSSDKSSDSKSNDPAEVTDDSSDSKDSPSSAGTSTKSSNSNTSGNDAKSSSSAGKVESSSSSDEVPKSYAEAKVMPSGTYDCSKYNCFTTEYLNQEFLEAGMYGEILDERDGQVYKTVQIGEQIWMAQNLNYENAFSEGGNFSYCASNCAEHGRLYVVYTARLVCPSGWHLPDTTEFNTLFDAIGGKSTAGSVLKSSSGWNNKIDGSSGNGTDSYSFAALPAGRVLPPSNYDEVDYAAYFWSSTVIGVHMYYVKLNTDLDYALLSRTISRDKLSVRCVKDSD